MTPQQAKQRIKELIKTGFIGRGLKESSKYLLIYTGVYLVARAISIALKWNSSWI